MTTELGDFPRRRQTIPRLDLRPLAQLPPALRAPRAAPGPRTAPVAAQDLDPLQFYALLRISILILDIIGIIGADARDLALVELAAAFIIGFDGVALARLLRRAPVVLAVRVQRLDELLLDAGLALPVVVGDVVGPIASVPVDLTGVELTSSACEL